MAKDRKTVPRWLEWAREIQAIAQNGLTYGTGPFDLQRYGRLQELAAEIVAAHSELAEPEARELLGREKGYLTPKVDVRGVVIREGRILLVHEKADGRWTLPGGWVDAGEAPSRAVEREIAEEAGFETRARKLLAVYDINGHGHPPHLFHAYKLFFACEIIGGSGESRDPLETDDVGFFAPDALPELSLPRVTPSQIRRFFEHEADPGLPTDFD